LDLRGLLSIPYLLEAEAVETEPGQWLVRLAYPELPGCTAEGRVVEDALSELERRASSRRFPESRCSHPTRCGPFRIWDCRTASPLCCKA